MEICDSSKGLLVSLGAHLIFFLLVGAAGYQAYQKQQAQDPIYTVEIVSGSPYHGYGDVPGAHLGNGNPPAPAAAQQQAAPQESAPAPVMQPAPQDVIPDGQVAEDRPMAAASSVSSAAAGAAARPGITGNGACTTPLPGAESSCSPSAAGPEAMWTVYPPCSTGLCPCMNGWYPPARNPLCSSSRNLLMPGSLTGSRPS